LSESKASENSNIALQFITALKNNNFAEYRTLLENYLPDHLYRYTAHTNHDIDSIISGDWKLTNPKEFNDPYDSLSNEVYDTYYRLENEVDCVIAKILKLPESDKNKELRNVALGLLSNTSDYKEKYRVLKRETDGFEKTLSPAERGYYAPRGIFFEGFRGSFRQYIGDRVTDSGVGCLSAAKNNILMWAHYGKANSGFCIEYSTASLLDLVEQKELYVVPVYYSNDVYPWYNDTSDSEENSDLWYLPQFMYKKTDWAYEREWRIVVFQSPEHVQRKMTTIKDIEPERHIIKSLPVTGIFLGTGFKYVVDKKYTNDSESSQIEEIVRLFQYTVDKKIQIRKLRPSHNEYTFDDDMFL
jgi:hypothetical protein